MQSKPGKYSLFYRVYRRLRYLRYVRRKKLQRNKLIRQTAQLEEKQRRKLLKEKLRADKRSDREKRMMEQLEIRQNEETFRKEFESGQTEYDNKFKKQKAQEEEKLRIERYYRKRNRKRLIRVYKRACTRNIIRTLAALNPMNLPVLFKYIINNRQASKEFIIILLHSTILFIAAYLLIFLLGMLTSAISGLFFDYKSVIYYNEVLWLVKTQQWFGDSVKTVYASAPILTGIISVFLAIIYAYLRTDRALIKLFILWCILHGFNAFFGSLLVGSIFGKGIGHAIVWSYTSDTEKVLYSIISITALVLLGVFTTRSFLLTANTYYPKMEPPRFRRFIWAQVITPFIFGNAIIAAIMSPGLVVHEYTVALALIISIIPIAVGYRFYPALYFEEESIGIGIKIKPVFYSLAFIIAYRLILEIGIPFG